ncbi:hypothetical protein ACHHYP_02826 [Achlya hypogyna]|uniref:Uncharacterized protein n=1 Tax=Achlya hypogyna TaxID=1202772 RepID=A0A1V9ZRU9_ACHHY|nr:hypothetical protein ACHHYP_02826 [Achlya hypogyna]
MYEDAMRQPNGAAWFAKSQRQTNIRKERNQFEYQRHANEDILDKFTRLLELYTHAEGCAMEDFVHTGMTPRLAAFFDDHVKVFQATMNAELQKQVPSHAWWMRN